MTRLTTNSQETTIGDLLAVGNSLYLIPFFQREYRWSAEKIRDLIDDVLKIVDGLDDKHFLGAVIVHGRRANPTDPKIFEVIDGQQRLTTAFLFIAALVRTLSKHGHHSEAAGLARNYLQIGGSHNRSNLRVHSSRLDRAMMGAVVADLMSDRDFVEALLPNKLEALPSYGKTTGAISRNYKRFRAFFDAEMSQDGGLERVRQIYGVFLANFTVVQIDVLDPTDGPKIFDSLNSKQEPMRIGDLVRNELFRKISDESPEEVERIDEQVWQPFYMSFESFLPNSFEKFLFPYALTCDPNLKKSQVFIYLRDSWNSDEEPASIVQALDRMKAPYLDGLGASNMCGFSAELAGRFSRLSAFRAPSSIYPFTMLLGRAVMDDQVAEATANEILKVLESFLVRRAICGYEPTGLHAVFKGLWADLDGQISPEAVSAAVSAPRTVTWPDTEELKAAIRERPLYGSTITPYFLLEYDASLGGDKQTSIDTVEHVLPQSASAAWKDTYGAEYVSGDTHALPNLVPCTSDMNSSLGNNPYETKRERFRQDSKFKSTREFAAKYNEWNRDAFMQRAKDLGDWAATRWPHSRAARS